MTRAPLGLVMTGGGARGAYQAGVLKRIGEIKSLQNGPSPFSIVAGASVGAINGSMVAAGTLDFAACTQHIAEIWSRLRADEVYRTGFGAISAQATQWFKDLSLGGIFGGGNVQSLLDAWPLVGFLTKNLNVEKLKEAVDCGALKALAVTATDYKTGKSFTFIHGTPGHALWKKSRRIAVAVNMKIEHVLASAAIPVVFQPVKLTTPYGPTYFGDGCLRLITPLSPAIRLGARKIVAIGVRSQKAAEDSLQALEAAEERVNGPQPPPLAQVVGVILNAIFLDHLDADVEHLLRMNDLIAKGGMAHKSDDVKEPMKIVEAMVINPSVDLGKLADHFAHKMPAVVRYMMRGLGSNQADSADLMSYLLFDDEYAQALIDIGYKDAAARAEEIEEFIHKS